MKRFSIPGVFAPRWAAKVRDWAEDKRGIAVLEFALVAMPFFFLIFGLIEICVIFIMTSVLEHGAAEASRSIRTGQTQSVQGVTSAQFKQDVCDELFGMMSCNDRLTVDVTTFTSFGASSSSSPITSAGNMDSSGFGFNTGGSSQIVLVRVFYEWDLFTPVLSKPLANLSNDRRLLQATVAFRNEPF